jgi:hypothetical protein
MIDSRDIPEPLKREVRQACGFGCVICGMPVFEYDHIQDFSEVRCHDLANLALLCPNHHRDKTSGRLSREAVSNARDRPFNSLRALSPPYGLHAAARLRICLGSNCGEAWRDAADYPVLWINGEALLVIHREGETYTFSACITDDAGELVLIIERGALAVSTGVWDFRYEGRELSIRRAAGDIVFEATISDEELIVRRGTFIGPYETGLLIKPDGRACFSMSGLEIGAIAEGHFSANGHCMLAVVRRGCYLGEVPPGGGMIQNWAAGYEELAAELRKRMEAGVPGSYPPGLERFRPFPPR